MKALTQFKVRSVLVLFIAVFFIPFLASGAPLTIHFSDAEKAVLLGTDSNNNGVRDDIETYIARDTVDPNLRAALNQLAADYQSAFKVIEDQAKLLDAVKQIQKSEACIFAVYGKNYLFEVKKLMSEMFDNEQRSNAAIRINSVHAQIPYSRPKMPTASQLCRFTIHSGSTK